MKKKSGFFLPLLAILVCLGWMPARATTFLTFQSTYLGDGWFQYQMNVMNDPFFAEADITGLGLNFTNLIDESGDGTNWSLLNYDNTNAFSNWGFTNSYPARPYSETFLMRSSETTFKLVNITNEMGATVLFSLVLQYDYDADAVAQGIISGNIVGYANMPCLIPCDPSQADGSPTNFIYVVKLLPDVVINQLIQTNGNIYGVDFSWDSPSTFALQGSPDMNLWTNVAYIWSYPPETVWTTNAPLNQFGPYFRMELLATWYATNLPPLAAGVVSAVQPQVRVATATQTTPAPHLTGCHLNHGKIVINLTAQPGQKVKVQAVDMHNRVQQTRSCVARNGSATVSFPVAGLPSPVFFKAVPAP